MPGRCVVLSDHDRKVLHAVELQFKAEDPEFAWSFDARQQRLRRSHHQSSQAGRIAIAVALLFSAFMLVAGEVSGALALATATGLICMVWWFSDGTSRRVTHDPASGDRTDR